MKNRSLIFSLFLSSLCLAQGQTIVGWTDAFSTVDAKTSVPDTLAAHVTVNTPSFDDLEFSNTNIDPDSINTYIVLRQSPDETLDDYGLAFSVTVAPGYSMDVTGINVIQQGYRRNGNVTVGFYYFNGSEYALVPATTSTLQTTPPPHSGQEDYSNNTITLTGLTGTTQFAYIVDPQVAQSTQLARLGGFELIGTISLIPEPGAYALMASIAVLGWVCYRRRLRQPSF